MKSLRFQPEYSRVLLLKLPLFKSAMSCAWALIVKAATFGSIHVYGKGDTGQLLIV